MKTDPAVARAVNVIEEIMKFLESLHVRVKQLEQAEEVRKQKMRKEES